MASDDGIEANRIFNYLILKENVNFLPGACTECHKVPSEEVRMMACSKCRLVGYCGKECQMSNWTYHKKFCKATKSVATDFNKNYLMETAKEKVEQGMPLWKHRSEILEAVRQKLNRKLDVLETKVLMSAKVCEICKDGNPEVLKPCKSCYMVFYCSEKHANQDFERHSKFCSEYFLSLQCNHLLATKGSPIPVFMPFKVPTISEYMPLSGTMKDYMNPTFDSIDACLSEWVSYPLSLLYALEHTGLSEGTKKVSEVNELTIVMGDPFNSTWRTMAHNFTWEYMFHLLPKLRILNVILCEGNKYLDINSKSLDDKLCSDCISRKCKFNVTVTKNFHTYESSDNYKKPDVICNHQVVSRDGPEERYVPFPDAEVTAVLLGTNKDKINESLRILMGWEQVDILLPLQLNPFRGMRPIKFPLDCMKDGGFLQYTNCYIVGLRRQIGDAPLKYTISTLYL